EFGHPSATVGGPPPPELRSRGGRLARALYAPDQVGVAVRQAEGFEAAPEVVAGLGEGGPDGAPVHSRVGENSVPGIDVGDADDADVAAGEVLGLRIVDGGEGEVDFDVLPAEAEPAFVVARHRLEAEIAVEFGGALKVCARQDWDGVIGQGQSEGLAGLVAACAMRDVPGATERRLRSLLRKAARSGPASWARVTKRTVAGFTGTPF